MVAISIIVLVMVERSIGEGDTLAQGESLTENQILTSKNGTFQLGFFETSQGTGRFYLSIRYTKLEGQPLVWIANRDKALPDATSSNLQIATNGNLELFNGRDLFWNTSLSLSTSAESAVLREDGNLVLKDGGAVAAVVWQSFDHPTHTWLPGATLGFDKKTGSTRRLVSWKSNEDPSPGEFAVEISPESKLVLKWKETTVYYESDGSANNQFGFDAQLLNSLAIRFEKERQSTYVRLENTDMIMSGESTSRVFAMLVMDDPKGRLKRVPSRGVSGGGAWAAPSALPPEDFCGAYGELQLNNSCTCLFGFLPSSSPNPMGRSCYRSTSISDCNGKRVKEGFKAVSGIKWPNQPKIERDGGGGDNECKAACLQTCSCTAYAFDGSECLVWEGDLYGIRTDLADDQKLHVKLASSDLPDTGNSKTLEVVIAVVVSVLVLVSGGFLGFFYNRRTKHNKEPGADLLSFDFDVCINSTNDERNMEFDLPMFSYSSVSAATNNFSPQNKLGEGGFGPVYKGELLSGERIALKRLSQKSGQGFEEFRNEIILIAKLQHRNLVRILGCCIHPVESILIYEYMPNKSLDMFLFGSTKQEMLDWKTRTRIVEGIAQGLLYLHEYSRVRIIHRDLKASNILLDDEMNPKISDFGLARIFEGTDSQAHTNRVVGTFGYIAPEYAMEGLFSIKSDVYSFGVLVLEIISGRKNTGFYKTDSISLPGHAWELWISGRGVELVDEKAESLVASTALRYTNVGLLCVQENPNDRPNMSSVVSMLSSEIAALPQPKKPAFSTTRLVSSSSSQTKSAGDPYFSGNHLSNSDIVPR
ncbi:G-type lectin S-receptor-like serine/threonine-protein kinase0 [Salvia divinorum]|uniref:Receptor-like serine/threonine-protein kinase n=1 Tax=Salvia divinorum TaxID=28513 RepID=A0ABD1IKJ7_SALDI